MDDHIPPIVAAFPELDATAFAEAVWLAAGRPAAAAGAVPLEDQPETLPGEPGTPTAQPTGVEPPTEPAPAPAPEPGNAPPGSSDAQPNLYDTWDPAEPANATLHRLHSTRALPRAMDLIRALRPLKRPWRAGRPVELDIEATVRAYAETRQLNPVFRQAPERWFDVALVIDDSATMAAWESVATEFGGLLAQVGAFRQVSVLHLTVGDDTATLQDGSGRGCGLNLIRSTDARTLILILSDCAARGWRAPHVWRVLSTWASSTPTALLNPLPVRLWRRGGLRLPAVAVTPSGVGTPNGQLRYRMPPLPQGAEPAEVMPLPAAGLTPVLLRRWAMTLMRNDPNGCDAVLMAPGRWPASERAAPVPEPTGPELVETFQHIATDPAERLARLCAPYSSITLPVLNAIRQELIPEATVSDVAELVAGGLMSAGRDRTGRAYLEFRPGVQAVLMSQLRGNDVWRVYDALTKYVAEHHDSPPNFLAAMHDPDGLVNIPAEVLPFARAALDALRVLPGIPQPTADQHPVGIVDHRPPVPADDRAQPRPSGITRARGLQATLDLTIEDQRDTGALLERLDRLGSELFDLAADWEVVDSDRASIVRDQQRKVHSLRQRLAAVSGLGAEETLKLIADIRRALRDGASGR
ncbi:SAV_2336 N-terminal domain-related protein [Dactylosporangium sp. NPDC049525]|uniref:SAV_2336 N-terminal domain-related protein n=1 Tax=Dactylosporangium sp. NPDC049525 TaxID=3154730 RepID=UPI003431CD6D